MENFLFNLKMFFQLVPMWFWGLTITLFGLVIGSFLNVVIHRVPRELSIVRPRSACPNCGHQISVLENIPVISYLLLGGKCGSCRTPISIVYPLVEVLTGFCFFLTFYKQTLQQNFNPLEMFVDSLFIAANIALIFIDYEHMILPDVITLPGIFLAFVVRLLIPNFVTSPPTFFAIQFMLIIVVVYLLFVGLDRWSSSTLYKWLMLVLLLLFISCVALFNTQIIDLYFDIQDYYISFWQDHLLPRLWLISVVNGSLGAIIGAGLLLMLRQVYLVVRNIDGMGLGDVKMMLFVGMFLGWQLTIATLIFASLLGTLLAIVFIVRVGRDALQLKIPFGVFLGAAAIILVLFGQEILDWYIRNMVLVRY